MSFHIELLTLGGFYQRGGSTFDKGNLVSAKIVIEDSETGEYCIPISEDTLAVAINVNTVHNLCGRN
jgi:hypothetical protein